MRKTARPGSITLPLGNFVHRALRQPEQDDRFLHLLNQVLCVTHVTVENLSPDFGERRLVQVSYGPFVELVGTDNWLLQKHSVPRCRNLFGITGPHPSGLSLMPAGNKQIRLI